MRFNNEIHAISDIIRRLETSCANELKPVRESVLRHVKDFKDGILSGTDLQNNLKITLASFPRWIGVLTNSKIVDLFNAFSEVYQQDIQAVDFNKIVAAQRIRSGYMYEKNTINIAQLPKNKLKNLRSLRNSCYGYFDCIFQVIDVVVSAKHRVIVKVWDGFQHNSSEKLFYLPQQDYLEKVCPASVYSLVGKEYNVEILVYGSFARDAKLLKPGDLVLFVNIHLAVTDLSTWNLTMHEGGISFKRGIYHVNPASDEYKEVESRCMRTMEELINHEDSFSIDCLVSDLNGQNEVHSNAIREHAKNTNTALENVLNPFTSMISEALDTNQTGDSNAPVLPYGRDSHQVPLRTNTEKTHIRSPHCPRAPDVGITVSSDDESGVPKPTIPPRKSNIAPPIRTSSIKPTPSRIPAVSSNAPYRKPIANKIIEPQILKEKVVPQIEKSTVSTNVDQADTTDVTYWPIVNLSKPKAPRKRSTPKKRAELLRNLSSESFEEEVKKTIFVLPKWLLDESPETRKKFLPIKEKNTAEKDASEAPRVPNAASEEREIIQVVSSDDDIIEIEQPTKKITPRAAKRLL